MIQGVGNSLAWQVAITSDGVSLCRHAASGTPSAEDVSPQTGRTSTAGSEDNSSAPAGASASKSDFSPEQLRQISELQNVDRKVKAHEMAHMAAGAGLVSGGPTYGYTTGPDGKRYAVSGEVGIDTSAANSPEATITKAQRIKAAALAPADPSAQDYRVAAAATNMEMAALMALARQKQGAASGAPAVSGERGQARSYQSVASHGSASVLGTRVDSYA